MGQISILFETDTIEVTRKINEYWRKIEQWSKLGDGDALKQIWKKEETEVKRILSLQPTLSLEPVLQTCKQISL